jgi:hypothetical protein
MTANNSVPSAAPDELADRLACVGLPARGAHDRQAGLSGPLQAFHRAVLGAFLTEADLRWPAQPGTQPRSGRVPCHLATATDDLRHPR